MEGTIELQWELSDYFCGDLVEVDEQLGSAEGATENLTNIVNMLLNNQDLLHEAIDYQKVRQDKASEYNKDKEELLNKGPQKKGWGTGVKDLDEPRGKSAPPGAPGGGWGPMEEEKDGKKRSKLKIRFLSHLDEKKKHKKHKVQIL